MSNLTLNLIRNSKVGTSGYTVSSTFPTVSRPIAERRPVARGAYSPKVSMSRPSGNQVSFIKSLLAEIIEFDAAVGENLRTTSNTMWSEGALTPGVGNGASQWIEKLIALRDSLRENQRQARQERTESQALADRPVVPAGRYAVDTDEGHTAFYRVDVSPSGYVTVELQVSDSYSPLRWTQAVAILRKIVDAGIKEAAIRYGQELGVCSVCGRQLTNEASRLAGIGPVCISKIG
jgi:Family of unknown function (DUF6011)